MTSSSANTQHTLTLRTMARTRAHYHRCIPRAHSLVFHKWTNDQYVEWNPHVRTRWQLFYTYWNNGAHKNIIYVWYFVHSVYYMESQSCTCCMVCVCMCVLFEWCITGSMWRTEASMREWGPPAPNTERQNTQNQPNTARLCLRTSPPPPQPPPTATHSQCMM